MGASGPWIVGGGKNMVQIVRLCLGHRSKWEGRGMGPSPV
jgi:hypothetical protein